MTEIISARFKSGGKSYYFAPNGLEIKTGDPLIVETSRGIEYAECTQGNTMVEDDRVVEPLKNVIRKATAQDLQTVEKNREKEKQAFEICQKKIEEHKLDMKLVEVEYSFDGSKILFFFISENRVDFRALVKDLASVFRARIELRQIGVRDEARILGGLGICGRPFCCNQFLDEFQPVSIKMAKTQNLSLNPTKISGTCGRLMCCLKYEQEAYEDAVKRCPKQESFVETPDGVGTVSSVNLLREKVTVRLDDQPESPKTFHNCEVCVVRNGKGKRPEGYVPPCKADLEKLRKVTPKEEPNHLASSLDALLGPTETRTESRPSNNNQRRSGRPAPKAGENKGNEPKKENRSGGRPSRSNGQNNEKKTQGNKPQGQKNQNNSRPAQKQAQPKQNPPKGQEKPANNNNARRRPRGRGRSGGGKTD